jgi:UDP-N-acetylglucosamine--N-acetylmuramyl-(pentapeptide) pyrophosphoryl-undecaprenol N-acetylglucosamine transferase
MTCFAVIAGGGTSGHVLPALAIAESLIDDGHDESEIVYFGARRGVETTLVPPTGLRHEFFDVVGLKREFSLSALKNNLTFPLRLVRARRRAIEFFREHRPRVVVSVGGYASLPAVLAARTCDVPIVVVSYDRRPGRSSQWAARWAEKCAVAYPDSTLPRAVWTGAPVRRVIRQLDRSIEHSEARARWNIADGTFLIGVIGGSLGSGVLNDAIAHYARTHRLDDRIAIHHVVGQRFYDSWINTFTRESTAMGTPGLDYRVVAYEDDMLTMYGAVDLLVARGGAGTVAEVAAAGVPAILVPWDGAADDHQRENVKWLSDADAAVVMSETDVQSRLGDVIDELRRDKAKLGDIADNARRMGETNRSTRIATLIDEVVAGTEPG